MPLAKLLDANLQRLHHRRHRKSARTRAAADVAVLRTGTQSARDRRSLRRQRYPAICQLHSQAIARLRTKLRKKHGSRQPDRARAWAWRPLSSVARLWKAASSACFMQPAAFVIVLGGTLAAVLLHYPRQVFMRGMRMVKLGVSPARCPRPQPDPPHRLSGLTPRGRKACWRWKSTWNMTQRSLQQTGDATADRRCRAGRAA